MVDRQPLARLAALSGFIELSDKVGIDVDELFRRSELDMAGPSQPDRWIAADAVADLLEKAATLSRQANFGLQLAENRRLANLGPLSMVIREEPNLRGALHTLMRYNHMYNEAVQTRLIEIDETATIRVELHLGHPRPARQSIELAVGTLFGVLAHLAGHRWRPLAVCFRHTPPSDLSVHHRVFGTAVTFNQDLNGILLRAADLDASNTLADPVLLPYAQRLLAPPNHPTNATIVGHTRELIEMLLPAGRCSSEQVARSLGISRRTLHRKLQRADTTFTGLLDATRVDLAQHLVSNQDNSLTDITEMLMFSSSSNFSRWFRDHFGMSPRAWRSNQSH
jgi:AraC-like DNA-binding protein